MAWQFNNESFAVCGSYDEMYKLATAKNGYKNPMLYVFHLSSSLTKSLWDSPQIEILNVAMINSRLAYKRM